VARIVETRNDNTKSFVIRGLSPEDHEAAQRLEVPLEHRTFPEAMSALEKIKSACPKQGS